MERKVRGEQRTRFPGQHDTPTALPFCVYVLCVCHYQTHLRHVNGAGEEHSGKARDG